MGKSTAHVLALLPNDRERLGTSVPLDISEITQIANGKPG